MFKLATSSVFFQDVSRVNRPGQLQRGRNPARLSDAAADRFRASLQQVAAKFARISGSGFDSRQLGAEVKPGLGRAAPGCERRPRLWASDAD